MKNTHSHIRRSVRHVLVSLAVVALFSGGAALASGKTKAPCNPQSHAKSCGTTTTVPTTTNVPTTTATVPTTTTTATTTTTTATTTTTSGAQLLSSTVTAGQALSGTVTWTVTTAGDVAKVEFWANNIQLGASTAAPWTDQLATTSLPNGTNQLGLALVSSTGARTSVQVGSVTVQNGPSMVSLPSISGTATVGQSVTASTGTWSPTGTSYAMQWQRCDSSGGACGAIASATGGTYTVVSADAGSTLRVAVTATNAYGSALAASAATGTVSSGTSAPSSGTVLWNGDFEPGNFSQFDSIQEYTTGRASVVNSAGSLGGPAAPRKGSDFFQCRVVNGDNVYGGERCETLKGGLNMVNGADQYYGWSLAMPANLPANGLTGQFHGTYDYAQADIQFFIDHGQVGAYGATSSAPRWVLGVNGGPAVPGGQYVSNTYSRAYDLGPLSNWRGAGWIDVVLHIKWADTTTGTVELWMKKAGDSTYTKYVSQVGNVANLYQGYTAYLKLGLYRTQSSGLPDGYIWFDQARSGTTFASVDPSS